MKVIAICGFPGSGKTTAIEAIEDLGIIVTMGDVVREEVKNRNLEPSGNNIGKIAKELREKNGPAIIAEKCVELIKRKNEKIIFVDGVRSISEVTVFRKYWTFPIIAIIVDEEKRFKHLFERNRSDDPKTLEDLKERDKREIEFGLDKVLEIAEYRIYNNSSIEALKKKARKIVLEIIQN
ncbi:MAG: AAA family ATPase [Candidatus Lokiarchaeia archaeon]|nr:AAA family ATPase [Candidatus Lokiarchaeia archaeon]